MEYLTSFVENNSSMLMNTAFVFTGTYLYFRFRGYNDILNAYSYLHETYKRLKRRNVRDYVPCLHLTDKNTPDEETRNWSLWLINVKHIELIYDESVTPPVHVMDAIVSGIRRFKVRNVKDKKKKPSCTSFTSLWAIANAQFKELYPKEIFPEKIIIHFAPETMLCYSSMFEYDKKTNTITLEKDYMNVFTC